MKFEIEVNEIGQGFIKLDGERIKSVRAFVLRAGVGKATTLQVEYIAPTVEASGVMNDIEQPLFEIRSAGVTTNVISYGNPVYDPRSSEL